MIKNPINLKKIDNEHKIRCNKCGKMLANNCGVSGYEIKCLRCGTLNIILERMIEQVIITDKDGKIIYINEAVQETTGFTLHEAIGKTPSQLWGGQMNKDFYFDMWNKIKNKKESVKLTIKNKKKNGEPYNVELLISPIFSVNGDILFFIGIEVVIK